MRIILKRASVSDSLAFIVMLGALFGLGALGGIIATRMQLFPVPQLEYVWREAVKLRAEMKPKWFVDLPAASREVQTFDGLRLAPGLIMVVGVTHREDPRNFVRVMDRDGNIVHELLLSWFDIWGQDGNFSKYRRPKTEPGDVLHGSALAKNGDLIANFNDLSTVRISPCGEVRWKLDNLGHHSIDIDDSETIWVGGEKEFLQGQTGFVNHQAPLKSWTIQAISPDGDIIRDIEILDILRKNDLLGLMYLSTKRDRITTVQGDTLHANDIEIFPSTLESTVFNAGDIMISLRNINTILVIEPDTLAVKFRSTGQFLRQHDPDFIGGDQILLFDNRNLMPGPPEQRLGSRILQLDAVTGEATVVFEGEGATAFFSEIMGKQQLLPNGNLLITSPMEGRALEVSKEGELVWQYHNVVSAEATGIVTDVTVLPPAMDKAFFRRVTADCR